MKGQSQLTEKRDKEFCEAYRKAYKIIGTPHGAIAKAIDSGSSRFWIEPECLRKIIYRMQKGDGRLLDMKPHRRNMFFDLYVLYHKVKNDERTKNKSISDIANIIVEYPASSFYIKHGTAQRILYKELKK